jgi:hypothetical protein
MGDPRDALPFVPLLPSMVSRPMTIPAIASSAKRPIPSGR